MRKAGVAQRLKRFRAAQGGAAAVEFAIILPFMLLLFVGSIEASSLITVDRRIDVISGTVGDLVARTRGTLSASKMTDYFQASQNIIYPYRSTGLKQVVSLVAVDSAGLTSVVWSCATNGGTKRAASSTYELPAKMNTMARGGWVVVSEAEYAYAPVLGIVFTSDVTLLGESFYLPRYSDTIGAPSC